MQVLRKIVAFSMMLFLVCFAVEGRAGMYSSHDSKKESPMTSDETIVQIAVANPDFTTLVTALKAADLTSVLGEEGPFTVFAPTNDAFSKLPKGTLEMLMKPENKEQLKAVLTYHVVPGKVLSGELETMKVKTLNGQELSIVVKDGEVTVNGVKVVMPDIEASNGVIHVIDGVLIPQS